MLRKGVDDLKWKLNYEKGVNTQMVELLEKKVATYLVQINTLQENEVEMKTKAEQQEKHIDEAQKKIKALVSQLTEQTIANEKLRFKLVEVSEHVVSITDHEKLQSDLNIANSLIKYKNGKIEN